MTELLCDMDYVKAEYVRAKNTATQSDPCFRISFRSSGEETCTSEIDVNNAAHFLAELDVLAALIRARTLKTQLTVTRSQN